MIIDRSVLVMFSGGADSVYMFQIAGQMYRPECINTCIVNYGQKHSQELYVARNFLQDNKANFNKLFELNISDISKHLRSKLIDDSGVKYEGVSEWHVPGRNLMFLSMAYAICESNNIDKIWIGCDFSDRLGLFPDCYQEWVVKVNELFKMNGSKEVNVVAPLLGMTKEMITTLLDEQYNIEMNDIYSGYGELEDQ